MNGLKGGLTMELIRYAFRLNWVERCLVAFFVLFLFALGAGHDFYA